MAAALGQIAKISLSNRKPSVYYLKLPLLSFYYTHKLRLRMYVGIVYNGFWILRILADTALREEVVLLTSITSIFRSKRTIFMVLALLLYLTLQLSSCIHTDSVNKTLAPIIPQMFFHPQPIRDDIVLNAGKLGRYRFAEDTHTYDGSNNISICPELVDLLNELQAIFKHPIIIISGYHSQQHQIYLWAKWLSDRPAKVCALNKKDYPTWEEWINASQALPGCPSFQSKHQTGDAVNFYWMTLDFGSKKERRLLTGLISEVGGTRDYTSEERAQFQIPEDDNYVLEVSAHKLEAGNHSGKAYFHVVFRPSEFPDMPIIDHIGSHIASDEDVKFLYSTGEILLIKADDYGYFAEVTKDTQLNDSEVFVQFFAKNIAKKLGDKIPINAVVTKREKPENGWGTQKVLLEYFDGKAWNFSKDVTEFQDHYLLPKSKNNERKIPLHKVRVPIIIHKLEVQ